MADGYRLRFLTVAIVSCLALSCDDMRAPPRDNGDASFVRQAVPKVLGRRLRSHDELRFYTEYADRAGRAAMLDLLFRHPSNREEYVRHWAEMFMEYMRVGRSSDGPKSLKGCYPEPEEDFSADIVASSSELASFVHRTEATLDPYLGAANRPTLTQVLQSSIVGDNLAPFMRAHLFAMWSRPVGGAEVTEANRQRDLSDTFHRTYLSRSMDCLGCHNSATSVTGAGSSWNRHFPIPGHFEKAIYGGHTGPLAPGTSAPFPESVWWTFRTGMPAGSDACEGSLSAGTTVRPFGLRCVSLKPADSLRSCEGGGSDCLCLPTYLNAEGETESGTGSFLGNSERGRSIWDVEAALRQGMIKNRSGVTRALAAGPRLGDGWCGRSACTEDRVEAGALEGDKRADLASEFNAAGCTGCHAEGMARPRLDQADELYDELVGWAYGSEHNPDDVSLVIPGESGTESADRGMLWRLVSAGGMPPGGLAAGPKGELLGALDEWAAQLVSDGGCELCGEASEAGAATQIEPDSALAGLVAQSLSDRIWQTLLGSSLRLVHDFSRTSPQGKWLMHESEYTMGRTWSLEGSLRSVLLNPHFFNRPAPADSGLGTLHENYELPLVLDPWVAADPRRPPVAEEGWEPGGSAPSPDAAYVPEAHPEDWFNGMGDGIHRRTVRAILNSASQAMGWSPPKRYPLYGDYFSQKLVTAMGQFMNDAEPGSHRLSFEGLLGWDNLAASCEEEGVAADWIDQLVDAVSPATTYHDVSNALHLRLINQATPPEALDAVAEVFGLGGAADLEGPVGDGSGLAVGLREICGALLISPQFLLAGLEPPGLGASSSLRACLPGETCGYAAICREIRDGGVPMSQGWDLVCPESDNGRFRARTRLLETHDIRRLCPRGRCFMMPWADDEDCAADPRSCLPPSPPESPIGCDPRCSGEPLCCGRMPKEELLTGPGILVAPAAGGLVRKASGVTRLDSQSSSGFALLQKGDTIQAGDILRFEPGAVFKAKTPLGGMRTKRSGILGKPIREDVGIEQRANEEGKRGPWMMLVVEAMPRSAMEFPFDELSAADTPNVLQEQFLASDFYRWGGAGRSGLSSDIPGCQRTVPVPGDGVDNDCDGQNNEEVSNGQDDDSDGLVDEDLAGTNDLCPGKFGSLDGVDLAGSGSCEVSFASLKADCPAIQLAPFGEMSSADFSMVQGSDVLAEAQNVKIGGDSYDCEILYMDDQQGPVIGLSCQNSSGSCEDLLYPF